MRQRIRNALFTTLGFVLSTCKINQCAKKEMHARMDTIPESMSNLSINDWGKLSHPKSKDIAVCNADKAYASVLPTSPSISATIAWIPFFSTNLFKKRSSYKHVRNVHNCNEQTFNASFKSNKAFFFWFASADCRALRVKSTAASGLIFKFTADPLGIW